MFLFHLCFSTHSKARHEISRLTISLPEEKKASAYSLRLAKYGVIVHCSVACFFFCGKSQRVGFSMSVDAVHSWSSSVSISLGPWAHQVPGKHTPPLHEQSTQCRTSHIGCNALLQGTHHHLQQHLRTWATSWWATQDCIQTEPFE